jgi:hypothetical protein
LVNFCDWDRRLVIGWCLILRANFRANDCEKSNDVDWWGRFLKPKRRSSFIRSDCEEKSIGLQSSGRDSELHWVFPFSLTVEYSESSVPIDVPSVFMANEMSLKNRPIKGLRFSIWV